MTRSWGRFAAVVVAGALAYAFVIAPPGVPEMISSSLLIRGLLAGLVVGIGLSETSRSSWGREWLALAGLAAGLAGVSFLGLTVGIGEGDVVLALVSVLVAAGVAVGAAELHARWAIATQVAAVAIVVTVGFWALGFLPGPYRPVHEQQNAFLRQPLVAEQYSFDGEIFRRTVVLMKEGSPFYEAFAQANREDARIGDAQLASPFNFREPLLFYLWVLVPGSEGPGLLALYAIFAAGATVAGWFVSKRFVGPGVALLPAIALTTYFAWFGLLASWFTMMELWAAFFVIGAFALYANRLYVPSAILISIAVAIRELAIVFVPVWVIGWLLSKNRLRDLPGLLVVCVVPIAAIGVHVLLAPASRVAGLGLAAWMNSTGFPRLMEALRFGADLIPLAPTVLPLALVCGLLGCLFLRDPRLRWSMLAALLVPAAFLLVFSKSEWDYYWGGVYTSTVIALAPLVLVPLLRPSESSVVIESGRPAFIRGDGESAPQRASTGRAAASSGKKSKKAPASAPPKTGRGSARNRSGKTKHAKRK